MTKAKITDVDWNEWFEYDETSPSCLRWKIDIYNCFGVLTRTRKGMVAGSLDVHGYYRVQLNKTHYKVHRIIYEMLFDVRLDEDVEIDHDDGIRSNNKISNLKPTYSNPRNMKRSSSNTSGVNGVSIHNVPQANGYAVTCWRASWTELDGTRKNKSFSVNKYGYDNAFELACKHRIEQINRMNKEGAGYTERHGNG